MQSLLDAKPATGRFHSFDNGRFVPDAFRRYTYNTADATAMVIQSFDGAVKITLSPNSIGINAATVNINATALNISASTAFIGTITSNGHDIANTHKHIDTQPGSGDTGVVL
jgi:phage baseplate assembly protein gpV